MSDQERTNDRAEINQNDSKKLEESIINHQNLLVNDLQKLLSSSQNFDTRFRVHQGTLVDINKILNENSKPVNDNGDSVYKEFKAHKIILAARCEYFRALLFNDFLEGGTVVEPNKIEDLTLESGDGVKNTKINHINIYDIRNIDTFQDILNYCYTGSINLSKYDSAYIIDILCTADQFGLENLINAIMTHLLKLKTTANYSELLNVSLYLQLETLSGVTNTLSKICNFLDQNAQDLVSCSEFCQLSSNSLQALLSRSSFYAKEIDIFNALINWRVSPIGKLVSRTDFDNILKHVRFDLMDDAELFETRRKRVVDPEILLDALENKRNSGNNKSKRPRGVCLPDVDLATEELGAEAICGECAYRLIKKPNIPKGDHNPPELQNLDRSYNRNMRSEDVNLNMDNDPNQRFNLTLPNITNRLPNLNFYGNDQYNIHPRDDPYNRDFRISNSRNVNFRHPEYRDQRNMPRHARDFNNYGENNIHSCARHLLIDDNDDTNSILSSTSKQSWTVNTLNRQNMNNNLIPFGPNSVISERNGGNDSGRTISEVTDSRSLASESTLITNRSNAACNSKNGTNPLFLYNNMSTQNTIIQQQGLVIKLGKPSFVNLIKLNLWVGEVSANGNISNSYSYKINTSMDGKDWQELINYEDYSCRGNQTLFIPKTVVYYLQIIGTRPKVTQTYQPKYFSVARLEVIYDPLLNLETKDSIIYPAFNIAKDTLLIKGVSQDRSALFSNKNNYDWNNGYTCHQISPGECIILAFNQPYMISTFRLRLWDLDSRRYSYNIEVSVDQVNWELVANRTELQMLNGQIENESRILDHEQDTQSENNSTRVNNGEDGENRLTQTNMTISDTQSLGEIIQISRESLNPSSPGETNNNFNQSFSSRLDSDDNYEQIYETLNVTQINNEPPRIQNQPMSDRKLVLCRSWQTIQFSARPVCFVKITGTKNTVNEIFHLVYFEAPAASGDKNENTSMNQRSNLPIGNENNLEYVTVNNNDENDDNYNIHMNRHSLDIEKLSLDQKMSLGLIS